MDIHNIEDIDTLKELCISLRLDLTKQDIKILELEKEIQEEKLIGMQIRTRALNKEVIILDVLMQDDDDFLSLENFALKRREKIA
tara:strand:- start:233 stop:487 length:255 start_codon:yes stop_codon:yes gene_type:complete